MSVAAEGVAPSVADDSDRVILVNRALRFFTILSDGERSVVPPYIEGGDEPYGFVISTDTVLGQPGRLRYWWRFVPRDSRLPGV